jgi:hypothetical protein
MPVIDGKCHKPTNRAQAVPEGRQIRVQPDVVASIPANQQSRGRQKTQYENHRPGVDDDVCLESVTPMLEG